MTSQPLGGDQPQLRSNPKAAFLVRESPSFQVLGPPQWFGPIVVLRVRKHWRLNYRGQRSLQHQFHFIFIAAPTGIERGAAGRERWRRGRFVTNTDGGRDASVFVGSFARSR
ncbi:unnamed protein product [Pleuronectes platessa]|uniref:Uncharacterized protein n=1 Tax=Pleuronectes platessa TaxID=8262 RepID=A0A9N7UGI0_PLEPL|nr:unnamed protein product [Pleuronectes platessa]